MRALTSSLLHLFLSLPIHLVDDDDELLNRLGRLTIQLSRGPAELLA